MTEFQPDGKLVTASRITFHRLLGVTPSFIPKASINIPADAESMSFNITLKGAVLHFAEEYVCYTISPMVQT